jgi:hypothetical protein
VFVRLWALIFGVVALGAAGNPALAQMPEFGTAILKGVCGFTQAANLVAPPHFLPRPVVGTMKFDGAGSVTLTATANNAGTVMSASESGSYSVNPDGRTGTIDFSATGGAVRGFVIVAGGQELRFINTGKVNPATGFLNQVIIGECDF